MQLPLQVSFRDMDRPEAIEAIVRERAAGLDKFAGDITSCRVVVKPAGKHRQRGKLYEVRIDLTLPGGEVVVTRDPGEHPEYKDLQVALRDAFDAARRKLEDCVRRRRRDVKAHRAPPRGRVVRLFPAEGYGFLETPDGREIYFHRRSVLRDAFDRLEIGTAVRFAEEEGDDGPQASTVKLPGRHSQLP